LEIKPSFRIEDDAAAAHLYRIAREAVINANKHAQAREIIVKLQRSRREMVLHVIDDGVGLSHDPKLKQGLGLHIMNYRAQLVGGRLEIDSPKNRGTRVSCYLPLGVSPSRNAKNGEQPAELTETVPSGAAGAISKF
jgi:signal transduction histidine kinase